VNRKLFIVALFFGCLFGCDGTSKASSGDRVLVAKCLYDTNVMVPQRFHVVVFKYPERPVEKGTPKNYIKRLMGLPGEIIAIFFGRIYRWAPENGEEVPYRKEDEGKDIRQLWSRGNLHDSDARHGNPDDFAAKLFNEGKFKMVRKPPDVIMTMRRIVNDINFQPRDLKNVVPPRWNPKTTKAWQAEDPRVLTHKGDTEAVDWVRYQHLVVERSSLDPVAGGRTVKPQLITDRMGYNSYVLERRGDQTPAPNWVGDLMLECNVEIQKGQGEFYMELSKGIYRFQARFKLADGLCTLVRIHPDGKEEIFDQKSTGLHSSGTHLVRFANIDARVLVWVNRELPFGEGHQYPPPDIRHEGESPEAAELRRGPKMNDLEPASLGSKGAAVVVKNLRVWRDTYYTTHADGPDFDMHANLNAGNPEVRRDAWSTPAQWEPIQKQGYRTIYVQPGHYLCLGDNSTASSDSRDWGLVPDRLLLGRALAVYYPIPRLGTIK
jgi:signal peptidase I